MDNFNDTTQTPQAPSGYDWYVGIPFPKLVPLYSVVTTHVFPCNLMSFSFQLPLLINISLCDLQTVLAT